MFGDCTSLTTAPKLPATTLSVGCYSDMFYGCTSLTTAPELPATTLATQCYNYMFYGCTSLTTAPELPATTLVTQCYNYMFYGCTSLNYVKAMFTTFPTTTYTKSWLGNVSSTGTFVKNTEATWNVSGPHGVPYGWNIVYFKEGHQYVDLGLPSGTKWATMNVGASSETDYGNYYMYGKGSRTYNSTDTPYAGTEDPLNSSVDTATQVWGGSWHMPTDAQMQELTANTTYQWVTNYKGSGINGGTFTATNGAVLFIPAAGAYWEDGSLNNVGTEGCYWGSSYRGTIFGGGLFFYDGNKNVGMTDRSKGLSVRPVIGNVIPKLYDYLYEDLSYGAKDTTKTAIGICVIPGGVLPDGKARFMSLKGMTLTSPNKGGSDTSIYWGGYGSDIPTLTNFQTVVTGDTTAAGTNGYGYVPKNGSYQSTPHIPSPIDYFSAYSSAGATSDLDGKANTEKILAVDNAASTAWQTAASITNVDSTATVHPAAQCCWRFNQGSTNKGDWYLPSIGELAFIIPNFNNLQTAISDVSGVQLGANGYYWSSTEYDANHAWLVSTYFGTVSFDPKNDSNYVRAFYKL
jgi:hypothetical protein